MGRPRPQTPSRLDAIRTFYVVRHAKAGKPEEWSGDDRQRPLTKKGVKQAEGLVEVFKKFSIAEIYSSDFLRCVQTVEPLGRACRLEVQRSPSLEFGRGLEGLTEFLGDRSLDGVVLSTHGDIVWELVQDLVAREVVGTGDGRDEKGSTWVLGVDDHGVAERARYIPAPRSRVT